MSDYHAYREKLRSSKNNPADMQDDDGVLAGLKEQILNIPIIVDLIFDNLPLADLHCWSRASKTWCSKTGDYIRGRRTLLLKCQDSISELRKCLRFLEKYKDFILKFKINGVHFSIKNEKLDPFYRFEGEESDWDTMDKRRQLQTLIKEIFFRVEIKHIIIEYVSTSCHIVHNTILFPLLGKCLDGNATESIALRGDQCICWIQKIHKGFKNLKCILTDTMWGCYNCYEHDHQELSFTNILTYCSALQQLQIPVNLRFLDLFDVRNKLSLITSVLINARDRPCKIKAGKLAKFGTTLETLAIDTLYFDPTVDAIEDFKQVVQILIPCLDSTTKVILRFVECSHLLKIKLPVFPIVKEVHLAIDNFSRVGASEVYKSGPVQERLSQIFPNGKIALAPKCLMLNATH